MRSQLAKLAEGDRNKIAHSVATVAVGIGIGIGTLPLGSVRGSGDLQPRRLEQGTANESCRCIGKRLVPGLRHPLTAAAAMPRARPPDDR